MSELAYTERITNYPGRELTIEEVREIVAQVRGYPYSHYGHAEALLDLAATVEALCSSVVHSLKEQVKCP